MQVITFFSFKGGAGRSTTCLNTVPFLAEKLNADDRHPIILMDTDIESAGMTYLLNQQEYFRNAEVDVKEVLQEELNWSTADEGHIKDHSLFKHFVPVGDQFGRTPGSVLFLGVNDKKAVRRDSISGHYQSRMNELRKAAINNFARIVVMDSAAGDQFSAQLSVKTSKKLVVCMRPTRQFRVGTIDYLKRLNADVGDSLISTKNVILLPTVVPEDMSIDGESMLASAIEDISKKVKDYNNLSVNTEFVSKDTFGINEIKRFKWQEGVLYKLPADGRTPDEEEALRRYKKLAEAIAAE